MYIPKTLCYILTCISNSTRRGGSYEGAWPRSWPQVLWGCSEWWCRCWFLRSTGRICIVCFFSVVWWKYMCVCISVLMCVCICVYVCVCMCLCVCGCAHVCAYVCMHMHVCGTMYMYVRMYVYTYIMCIRGTHFSCTTRPIIKTMTSWHQCTLPYTSRSLCLRSHRMRTTATVVDWMSAPPSVTALTVWSSQETTKLPSSIMWRMKVRMYYYKRRFERL